MHGIKNIEAHNFILSCDCNLYKLISNKSFGYEQSKSYIVLAVLVIVNIKNNKNPVFTDKENVATWSGFYLSLSEINNTD